MRVFLAWACLGLFLAGPFNSISNADDSAKRRPHPGNREAREQRQERREEHRQSRERASEDRAVRRQPTPERQERREEREPMRPHPGNREAREQRQERREDREPVRPHQGNREAREQRQERHQEIRHSEHRESRRHMESARERERAVRRDRQNSTVVDHHVTIYRHGHRNRFDERTRYYREVYKHQSHRHRYEPYFRHGFRGGYYFPVRPCRIEVYFGYPLVMWLFADQIDYVYYRNWYGYDYDRYRVDPFPHRRVYYPTMALRNMAIEVSAYPTYKQSLFRAAMINLTQALASQIANAQGRSFTLSENDIVINYQESLRGEAIVVEGFVDRDNIHVAFKALLDLNNPDQTLVYVPLNSFPTDADLFGLRMINQRIQSLGGDPMQYRNLEYEEGFDF
ncbi:MAG: hypothetical protein IT289_13520 [Oligoflexia bacterium]|nr:hypothetical protein [Oligoflexia bacterium]